MTREANHIKLSQIQAWGDGFPKLFNLDINIIYSGNAIDINGTDSVSNGTLASWTSGKAMIKFKLKVIERESKVHDHQKLEFW